jgi:S-adenosylmethionine:tRNA ribosyltransferase-isomerase
MILHHFDYILPRALVSQRPLAERDASRLLLLERPTGACEDRAFRELPDLLRGDELVVVNNSRVLPARLFGHRRGEGAQTPGKHNRTPHEFLTAQIELMLARRISVDTWEALVHPGRKVRVGEHIVIAEGELEADVIGRGKFGLREVRFTSNCGIDEAIERFGHVPLPPYIDRPDEPADRARYQTLFAKCSGAVAAPTAGLHFSESILDRLRARGIDIAELTLHVGLGTFQPIHAERLEDHKMHSEDYEIPEATAARIQAARTEGRPILAIGTTVVRALEDAAQKCLARHGAATIEPVRQAADIFIFPGHRFHIVNQLLTNFHLPKSSLLALVCAFAGRGFVLKAYEHAVGENYRFYSYGDCMLIR